AIDNNTDLSCNKTMDPVKALSSSMGQISRPWVTAQAIQIFIGPVAAWFLNSNTASGFWVLLGHPGPMTSGVFLGPLGPISSGYTWVLLVQWRLGTPGSFWSNGILVLLRSSGPMASGCSWVPGIDCGCSQVEIDQLQDNWLKDEASQTAPVKIGPSS
ncbi:hypothetical protein STEG23_001558, partial [Scotinomys teguina]